MLKKEIIELFPPVKGTLTINGEPLSGVKIKQGYQYIDVMLEDVFYYTTTDSEGRFSFPERTMESAHPNNPFASIIIWQGISIVHDIDIDIDIDDVYLWHANSRGVKHIPYFVEMLADLNCDLATHEEAISIIDSRYPNGSVNFTIDSICRWPKRAEIEKKKADDLEKFNKLLSIEKYGNINGLT